MKCGHSGSGHAQQSSPRSGGCAGAHPAEPGINENGDIGSGQHTAQIRVALGRELNSRLGDGTFAQRHKPFSPFLAGYEPADGPPLVEMTARPAAGGEWAADRPLGDRSTPASPSPAFPTRPSATCSLGARLDHRATASPPTKRRTRQHYN